MMKKKFMLKAIAKEKKEFKEAIKSWTFTKEEKMRQQKEMKEAIQSAEKYMKNKR